MVFNVRYYSHPLSARGTDIPRQWRWKFFAEIIPAGPGYGNDGVVVSSPLWRGGGTPGWSCFFFVIAMGRKNDDVGGFFFVL